MPPTHKLADGQARALREIESAQKRLSASNRAAFAVLLQRLQARGLKQRSLRNYLYAFVALNDFRNGAPIVATTADEFTAFIAACRVRYSDATTENYVTLLKAALRRLRRSKTLPDDIEDALTFHPARTVMRGIEIPESEFHLLLAEAAKEPRYTTKHLGPMRLALLWVLWDSGFRASEALSLRIGNWSPDDGGGTLSLSPDAPDLKTGPRTIYVSECSHALRAWLDLHPHGHDPSAFVFYGFRDPEQTKPLSYTTLFKWLKGLCDKTGVTGRTGTRRFSPHDFRHSAVTRRARAGWTEAELRPYFGWGANSTMPAVYIHLTKADQRDRVRRDAGIDELGVIGPGPASPHLMVEALVTQLVKGLERR